MKITTIGKGTIGGTLAELWTAAGHEVALTGRSGGDATNADAVLLAVPSEVVPEALAGVAGLHGKTVLDATNRFGDTPPPQGFNSVAEYVKAQTNGPTAKVFNLNFGKLFDRANSASTRPGNIWVGDEEARSAVELLSADIGFKALHGGPLERAATQEAFANLLMSIVGDVDEGLLMYWFAAP